MSISTEEIANLLWQEAIQAANAESARFAPNCAHDLRSVINDAARRMTLNGQTANKDLALATHNIRSLIMAMVKEARPPDFKTLHEFTFMQAKIKLCPGLWPFC